MSRRRWVFGPGVRLLRARPGDTLVVSHPGSLSPGEEYLLRRELEDAVGYRNDVHIVIVSASVDLTVVRVTP